MATKLGIHAPPQGATDAFKHVAEGLRAEIVTWLWDEGPQDTRPEWSNVVRLPTPTLREDPADYAARVHSQVAAWYASGIPAIFVPGNEPDLEGPWPIADWRIYLPRYADWLKQSWAGIVLACPAFSVARMSWMDSALADPFEYVCAHCYWPADKPALLLDRSAGGAWQWATRIGKPVLITEANSNPTTPTQVVDWLRSLSPMVAGVTLFLADGAESEWPFYDIPDQQAIIIRVGFDHALPLPPPPPPPPVVPPPPPTQSRFAYDDVSLDTFYRMVDDGSAGKVSPFRTPVVYAAISNAARQRDITTRLLLAWLRAENNMATNISAELLGARNAAGIKFVGQVRAISGALTNPKVLAPASEGFAPYCVFQTWDDFFWTLAVNIQTILPDAYASGDLASIASYYTTGDPNAGGGANKVLFFNQYSDRTRYPGSGGVVTIGPSLASIRARAAGMIGRKFTEEGTPEFGACEQFVEEACQDEGLIRIRYFSAATHIDALLANGVPIYQGQPPPGAILLFDRRFDPNGHICFADVYPFVITTYPGAVSRIDGTRWYAANGYIGYYIPDGVVEGSDMLPSDGTMDWGEVQIFWTALGAQWNPQAGIFTDWLAHMRAGVNYGVPVGPERGFENNTRVIQAFSTGVVAQWTAADNKVMWLGTLPADVPPAQLASKRKAKAA